MDELPNDGAERQQEQQDGGFEACGAKHSFCTVGMGECGMRKGHEAWGQGHVCNACSFDF